jgi:hypothetical protein
MTAKGAIYYFGRSTRTARPLWIEIWQMAVDNFEDEGMN